MISAEWERSVVYLGARQITILYKVVRIGLTVMEIFNRDLKEVKELDKWIYGAKAYFLKAGVV